MKIASSELQNKNNLINEQEDILEHTKEIRVNRM